MDTSALVDALAEMWHGMGPYLIALILLAGPTTVLFLYRLVTTRRRVEGLSSGPDMYWRCLACNSMNRDADDACYRCRTTRGVIVDGQPRIVRTTLAAATATQTPVVGPVAAPPASRDQARPMPAPTEPEPTPQPKTAQPVTATAAGAEPTPTAAPAGAVGVPVMDAPDDGVGVPTMPTIPRRRSPTWVGEGPAAPDERPIRASRRP
jgi:hypothetical protein